MNSRAFFHSDNKHIAWRHPNETPWPRSFIFKSPEHLKPDYCKRKHSGNIRPAANAYRNITNILYNNKKSLQVICIWNTSLQYIYLVIQGLLLLKHAQVVTNIILFYFQGIHHHLCVEFWNMVNLGLSELGLTWRLGLCGQNLMKFPVRVMLMRVYSI